MSDAVPASGGRLPASGRRPPASAPDAHGQRGLLVVLEGIDGSGRSTHTRRLEAWLRERGVGVTRTGLGSSLLAAPSIRRSRAGGVDPHVTALLDAADLAERAELVILPALRAGLVVLADRYACTPMARAIARGVDPDWLEEIHATLPRPDAVLFLDLDPGTALARRTGELDAYEAGMDQGLAEDVRASYRLFGARLAATFEANVARWGLTRVAAGGTVDEVAARLVTTCEQLLGDRMPGVRPS